MASRRQKVEKLIYGLKVYRKLLTQSRKKYKEAKLIGSQQDAEYYKDDIQTLNADIYTLSYIIWKTSNDYPLDMDEVLWTKSDFKFLSKYLK